MPADRFPDLTGKTILQVAPELSAGGVERTVLEMTEAIVAAGGKACLASKGGRMEAEFAALGGQLFRMNAKSKNPLVWKLNANKIERIVREHDVDLIHARSRAPAWSAYWAAKACDVPFVTTYHGAYSGNSGLKRTYNGVMARGDRVIANSDWIAAHVLDTHDVQAERLVTIPRGVDLAAFDPAAVAPDRVIAARKSWGLLDDKRLTLLLPGRLTEWKGQRLTLEALSLLSGEELRGLVLVLAGDPQGRLQYLNELEDRILTGELADTALIVPHISDMAAAYMAADVVLAPSVRPEAFGRVAAEASAMKKPVITSDHGGGRETVVDGETGARVEPGSASALAGAIRTLVAIGDSARTGMGEAGRKHVAARFSKEGLQAATLQVYKDVLEGRT